MRGTFRTVLHGGVWVTPVGHPGASGRAIVRFYGRTEVCWRFSDLHGLFRKLVIQIYEGHVAQSNMQIDSPVVGLGPFHAHGCETRIEASYLTPVERNPSRYLIGITDIEYEIAIGGQL